MSDQLSAAAAALGIPEDLVQRSAAARAAETGGSTDDIITAWAGGTAAPPASADTPAAPAAETPPPVETPAEPEPAAPAEVMVQPEPVLAPAATAGGVASAPIPDEVTPREAVHLPEVVTVPTAGIRERTNFVIPKWLTGALLVVPLFALFALGGASTGECGEATELRADVVTGEIVNCDGSAFTGSQIGGGGVDFIALGEEVYAGAGNCAGCHGPNGQGVGNFPAMTGVMTTFGACDGHIEWIELGSAGFQARGDTTYGDTNKPIGGGMPGVGGTLSSEQIAAVTAFERVRFGGADEEAVLADCGLVEEPEGGEGEDGEGDDGATEGDGEMEASAGSSG